MIMRRLNISSLLALLLCACSIEPTIERPAKVVINFERDYAGQMTRSSVFDPAIDDRVTGGVIAFYNAGTGELDSQCDIDDLDTPLRVALPERIMNIYVLVNMWYIGSDGSRKAPVFPETEEELRSMVYRIGGETVDGMRTERFDEAAKYGIPCCGKYPNADIKSGAKFNIEISRLFAKVSVTVDHSGMSGNEGEFSNVSLHIRQANARLMPFAESGSVAAGRQDILPGSDYESPMKDGMKDTFSLYVPENRLGTLLPANRDPSGKTDDALRAAVGTVADLATYMEFSSTIDKSAGGFGGDVKYRFYLGENPYSNFDIVRNNHYFINLKFNVDSVFDPGWKVDPGDDFEDRRLFCVTKDPAFTDVLPESLPVAVRRNRPGKVYVYMNRDGVLGTNHILGVEPSVNHSSESLSDASWSGDFSGLAALGLSAEYSSSTGLLGISVNNPSKFVPDKEIPVTLTLLPGGKTVTIKVLTKDNLEAFVEGDDFYLAMCRNLVAKGFVNIKRNLSVKGRQSSKALKFSNTASSQYLSDSPSAFYSDTVDLYAWGVSPDYPLELMVSSDDVFNDDPVSMSFKVYKPEFRTEKKELKLYVDGRGVPVSSTYYDRSGKAMKMDAFDFEMFSALLAIKATYSSSAGEKYTGFDGSEFFVDYLGSSSSSSDALEKLINAKGVANSNTGCLGKATTKPVSDLYSQSSEYTFKVYYPRIKKRFPTELTTDYFNEKNSSKFVLETEVELFGNKVQFSKFVENVLNSPKAYDVEIVTVDANTVKVGVVIPESRPFDLPAGEYVLSYLLANSRQSRFKGKEEIQKTVLSHNATLAPFAVMRNGGSEMTVYIVPAKVACYLKDHPAMAAGGFEMVRLCGKNNFYGYLEFEFPMAVGPNNIIWSRPYRRDMAVVSYQSIFPESFYTGGVFNRQTAETAMRRQWIRNLRFESGGSALKEPLAEKYSGCGFLNIRCSNQNMDYVLIE